MSAMCLVRPFVFPECKPADRTPLRQGACRGQLGLGPADGSMPILTSAGSGPSRPAGLPRPGAWELWAKPFRARLCTALSSRSFRAKVKGHQR